MSMEMHVFFHGELPTREALTATMQELGFPFAIEPQDELLDEHAGFMPMTYRGIETGVEFDVWSNRADIEEIAGADIDSSFDRMANFRWGSVPLEGAAGYCVAAAIAKLTGGVTFDDVEGRTLTVDETLNVARALLKNSSELGERAQLAMS